MMIAKRKVFELIEDLPDELDIDEIMYRLYVRQKLDQDHALLLATTPAQST